MIVENNFFKYEKFLMSSVENLITVDWIFNEKIVANDAITTQNRAVPNSFGDRYEVKKGKSKNAPALGNTSPNINRGESLTVCFILANYLILFFHL